MTATGRPGKWLDEHLGIFPSLVALLAVAVFWVVGLIDGIRYLDNSSSPIAMLGGFYVMLAAVALSLIITTAALSQLARHFSRQRTNPPTSRLQERLVCCGGSPTSGRL
jgi:uncharacterized membrane protein